MAAGSRQETARKPLARKDASKYGRTMAHMGGGVQPASVPEREALVGQLVGGTYRVEHLLGQGGRAAVWAGVNERTGGRVALKVIRRHPSTAPETESLLHNELLAASGISHPNVVSVFEVIEHDGLTCIVMEFLEGESLASFIARRGPLSAGEAMGLLLPAMRGVATAHALGVIHRDLRPQSIFLCIGPDGRVLTTKVLDFGISSMLERARERSAEPTVGVAGTPAHMAPEHFDKSKAVDERTDVYGFGVLFYEALTGKPPFPGEPDLELLRRVLSEPPPPLVSLRPDLPAELAGIIEKAMAKQPEQRYAGLDAMVAAIEDESLRAMPGPPSAETAEPRETPGDAPVPAAAAEQPSGASAMAGEIRVGEVKGPRPRAETLFQASGAFGSPALPDWAMRGTVRADDGVPRTHWAWRGLVILGIVLALGYAVHTYLEVTRQREAAATAKTAPGPASAPMPAGQAPPTAVAAPTPVAAPAMPVAAPAMPAAAGLRHGPVLPAAGAPPATVATAAAEEPPAVQPPEKRSRSKAAHRRRQAARAEPAAEKSAASVHASTPTAAPAPAAGMPAPTVRPPAPAADKPKPDESSPARSAKPRAGNLTQDDF